MNTSQLIRIVSGYMVWIILSACAGGATANPIPTATVTQPQQDSSLSGDDRPAALRALTTNWATNWSIHSIPYDEIIPVIPRDNIPALTDPQFVTPDEAAEFIASTEPVIVVEIERDARAYPLQILTWHEIVNDEVGGVPVIVTFCPLCNSGITFDRRLDGQVYEFGVSGLLHNSDLIMYDRTTESLFQQFTGQAIAGDLTGQQLTYLATSMVSFADFRAAYPDGLVLSPETGYQRSYGVNPYAGYDTPGQYPFLYSGDVDDRLDAMARVVGIDFGGIQVAYPYSLLSEQGVISDTQAGQDMVIFHKFGTNSALGAQDIASAEDVGATGTFDPHLDGQILTFRREGDHFIDDQTGSDWSILGQATSGPLAGRSLEPVLHGNYFWFSWAAFYPDTLVFQGP